MIWPRHCGLRLAGGLGVLVVVGVAGQRFVVVSDGSFDELADEAGLPGARVVLR